MTLAEWIVEAVALLFVLAAALFAIGLAGYFVFWMIADTIHDYRKQRNERKPLKDTRTPYERTLDRIRQLESELDMTDDNRRNT